jgi:hypothetical protein
MDAHPTLRHTAAMMKKRQLLAALGTGLGALTAARPALAACGPAHSPALLTVTGAIGHGNRGPLNPTRDLLMAHLKVQFDRAQVFDFAALNALPSITIKPTVEYDGKPHRLRGPLLAEVLQASGVATHQPHTVMMRAVDGYTVNISLAQAMHYRFIVATHWDDQPMPLGGLGPLWAIYNADQYPDMAQRALGERFAQCPWGLYHIDVQPTQAVG